MARNNLTNPYKSDTIEAGSEKSSSKTGDTDGMSKITGIKSIDFNDKTAIMNEINNFAKKYAYANVEHALEISPNGNMYSLIGTTLDVDSIIIGKEALKGSISIHNHLIETGKNKGDSFSIKDLWFAAENNLGKQYVISGQRRDAFEFVEYYTRDEIDSAWNKARNVMWERHIKNETTVIFEHEDVLRELNLFLEGFKFYENF